MTIAVCISCGSEKLGAWTMCPICAAKPQTKDEAMLCVALSDWFLDADGRRGWAQQIHAGIKPQLSDASRKVLSGFVTMFDEWGDANAELSEAAFDDRASRDYEALSRISDQDTPSAPSYIYRSVEDEAGFAAKHVKSQFKAVDIPISLDLLADPWVLGYVCGVMELGLLGLHDIDSAEECSDDIEQKYYQAFMSSIVQDEETATLLLIKLDDLEAKKDRKFLSGKNATAMRSTEESTNGSSRRLTDYLTGIFVCWHCNATRQREEDGFETCDICGWSPPESSTDHAELNSKRGQEMRFWFKKKADLKHLDQARQSFLIDLLAPLAEAGEYERIPIEALTYSAILEGLSLLARYQPDPQISNFYVMANLALGNNDIHNSMINDFSEIFRGDAARMNTTPNWVPRKLAEQIDRLVFHRMESWEEGTPRPDFNLADALSLDMAIKYVAKVGEIQKSFKL